VVGLKQVLLVSLSLLRGDVPVIAALLLGGRWDVLFLGALEHQGVQERDAQVPQDVLAPVIRQQVERWDVVKG
jgi:hypothetical protein